MKPYLKFCWRAPPSSSLPPTSSRPWPRLTTISGVKGKRFARSWLVRIVTPLSSDWSTSVTVKQVWPHRGHAKRLSQVVTDNVWLVVDGLICGKGISRALWTNDWMNKVAGSTEWPISWNRVASRDLSKPLQAAMLHDCLTLHVGLLNRILVLCNATCRWFLLNI